MVPGPATSTVKSTDTSLFDFTREYSKKYLLSKGGPRLRVSGECKGNRHRGTAQQTSTVFAQNLGARPQKYLLYFKALTYFCGSVARCKIFRHRADNASYRQGILRHFEKHPVGFLAGQAVAMDGFGVKRPTSPQKRQHCRLHYVSKFSKPLISFV